MTAAGLSARKNVRFPLAARISLLAIGNFALLGLVFAVYVRLQLSTDMKSFLMTAARERIIAISRQIALDLEDSSGEDRTHLLQRYSTVYGVTFYLFLNTGEQIAGNRITLPALVATRLGERPGPPDDGMRPGIRPPRREEDDPRPEPPGAGEVKPPPRSLPGGDPFLVETPGAPRYWVGVRTLVSGYFFKCRDKPI